MEIDGHLFHKENNPEVVMGTFRTTQERGAITTILQLIL
jgi:hypothetical protein